jgi:sulfoxide reductase heme-binding subunit YedZ
VKARTRRQLQQAAVTAAAAVPGVVLVVRLASDALGANPIEEVTHETGQWGLRLLLLSLAVTPVRRLTGWAGLAPFRRTLGLASFAYLTAHMLTFVGLDHFFHWAGIAEDVLERRYVTAGMLGFACLVPLALTSTRRSIKRLGRHWNRLHRLVYVAAVCGVVHYLWLVKADLRGPAIYAGILALLLATRAAHALRPRPVGAAGR